MAIIEGPIITVIGGFLASLGFLDIYIVYMISVAGDVIGDSIYYFIGRLGNHSIIPKYGHYFGISEEKILYAKEHYRKHFLKTIVIGKITEAPIVPIIIVAGVTKVDFKKFLLTIFLITLLKALVFSSIGFYFGKSYVIIGRYLDNYFSAMFVVSIVLVFGYSLIKLMKKSPIKI